MMRLALSPATSGLLRALIQRGNCPRDRILLTEHRSVDWQSLTFTGERHELQFRITGPGAAEIAAAIAGGIEDAEFTITGHLVADIACAGDRNEASDGSVMLRIEALTIEN
jgi:hypothetical protein